MRITIVTLFPDFFESFQKTSIIKRAIEKQLVQFETVNFRDYTLDKHHNVDDTPYGGGQGMVLSPQPIVDCLKAIRTPNSVVAMLTPQGKTFNQSVAKEFAQTVDHLILLCGHYEGFDERIRRYVDIELSLGDFVLTGGEPAAIVVADAIIRLLQGVILKQSHEDDSFENGLLEYPQYTRPIEYDGVRVPDVLLSGHHENIRRYRLTESLKRTLEKREDLLKNRKFTKEEIEILEQLKNENK